MKIELNNTIKVLEFKDLQKGDVFKIYGHGGREANYGPYMKCTQSCGGKGDCVNLQDAYIFNFNAEFSDTNVEKLEVKLISDKGE
jgi:hypothetical protein